MAQPGKKKPPKKLPHLNVRLAWLSKELQKAISDVRVVENMAEKFKITQAMAKRYLDELYAHWEAIAAPEKSRARHRVIDILYRAVEGAEEHFQFGAVVQAADKLARVHGLYEPDKITVSVAGSVALGGPDEAKLTQRMHELLNNPTIRDKARKLGLDLDAIDPPSES